ncbi:hypothetical protein L7F22_002007 [Adiantum nelumboides]|nr:hypothetical protein [Adiantum nelumboides]
MRLRLITSGKSLRQGWTWVKFPQNAGIKHSRALSFGSSCRCKHCFQYDLRVPSGGFVFDCQPSNLMLLNTYMVSQRHFASRSTGGEEDEDVLDDVESRLMQEDYAGDGVNMGDSSYGMGSGNFDYGEWAEGGGDAEVEGGESVSDGEEGEEGSDEEGDEEVSNEDSDEETANEMSDEEFEEEKSDEEFDELLAQTPLFNPPDIEFLRSDEPVPEFSFRPEGPVYYPGMEYEPEELDVTRPLPPRKREVRDAKDKEEISVEEVIDNADFRNVRYLTRFITESGTIIARREFKMRKKSHNRIVRAIKTARFFGLMPYTNMGRPRFVFNEPFDEFSEFYETDEDEKTYDRSQTGSTFQSRFNNAGRRDGGVSNQGWGSFSSQNFGRGR